MKRLSVLVFLIGALGTTAFANELDRDEGVVNAGRELSGTTVLRVDNQTGEAAVLKTNKVPGSEDEAQELVRGNFSPVDPGRNVNELDTDAGSSSWYFYYRSSYNYSYESYYYYGNWYRPYYTYTYRRYSYYYYGQCRGYRGGYYYGSRCW